MVPDLAGPKRGRPVASRFAIRQLLLEARRCKGPLDDPDRLSEALREAAAAVGAKVEGGCHAHFVPHGVTAVIILAESHMSISTWPEYEFALVDVLFCRSGASPELAWASLEPVLEPGEVERDLVTRRVSR